MIITGTLVNVGSIILGSFVGVLLKKGIPDRIQSIIFQALGLFTLFLGLTMAFETSGLYLLMIFSLILGGILGEVLKLDTNIEGLSIRLKEKLKSSNPKFTEGLITASMLFSIGSMAIIGPMNEAIKGDLNLILTKSLMDGITSIILAAAFGRGVFFSVLPVFILQATVGILSSFIEPYLDPVLIKELTAVGGLLILGIGISILEIKKINVINLLPSMVVVVVLYFLMEYLKPILGF